MADRPRWGDNDDDEQSYETPVDRHGFKTRHKISRNEQGQKVRVTTKIKVSEQEIRVPRRSVERQKAWVKFGIAGSSPDDTSVTFPGEVVMIEHPEDEYKEDDSDIRLQIRPKAMDIEDAFARHEDQPAEVESKPEVVPDKYLPPGMRSGARQDNENTLRVSNLPKETTENDLQHIFKPFAIAGRLARVSMPKSAMKEPRGFAYVAYERREDAERALKALQRYAFGNLILVLEWAEKKTREPQGTGGVASGFMSGYGKALAQDTTERVTYASNLTR